MVAEAQKYGSQAYQYLVVKNYRHRMNEYQRAFKKYQVRKAQEARQAAKHKVATKQARPVIFPVDTQEGREC